jgi:hypothetical protein
MTTNRRYKEQILLFNAILPEKCIHLPKYNMAPPLQSSIFWKVPMQNEFNFVYNYKMTFIIQGKTENTIFLILC